MKTVFRVEANTNIGLGHLMRCLALAQCLVKSNLKVCFIVSATTAQICKHRSDWVAEIIVVPEDLDKQQELAWMGHYIRKQAINFCVLDGYQFDLDYRAYINLLPCMNICFDDTNSLVKLPTDIVINGAQNAKCLQYELTAPEAIRCVGEEYRVIRQEFVDQPLITWQQRSFLTIVLGGSDPLNYTIAIVKFLTKIEFSGPIRVLTGSAFENVAELQTLCKYIAKSEINIQHIHNCQNIADIFSHSRLTISAAGASQFELSACGSPAILIVVADNQMNATSAASQQGWCEMLDARHSLDFNKLSNILSKLWNDEPLLQSMSSQAYRHRDLQGANRIVETMKQLYMESV